MDEKLLKIDGVLWRETYNDFEPLCPVHYLRLNNVNDWSDFSCVSLECAECEVIYNLPRLVSEEKKYIKNKVDSKTFRQMKILNLDDEAIPLAESKIPSEKDEKYFVTSVLTESKVGKRLIIYAGEKGNHQKTQIFIEPEMKRLAFDQKDLHPSDVFVKVEATFMDGVKNTIEKQSL